MKYLKQVESSFKKAMAPMNKSSDVAKNTKCKYSLIMAMFLSSILLAGCETLNPPDPGKNPAFAPTYPVPMDPKVSQHPQGGIYNVDNAVALFETPRARHAGDILTILLEERTDAQKKATTKGKKNDDATIVNPTILGRPVDFGAGYNFGFGTNSQRNFNGEGESKQNNQLTGSISVTVSKVLANGNLLVQGEKWIRINQGNEYVRLSGIVRPQDIKPDNTINSSRVANARIAYSGTGQVANSNTQGWFSKILWAPFFPL